jgi:hypothetical protein
MFNLSNLGIPIIQAPMAGGINNVFIRLMEGKMVLPFPRQNSMTASLRQLGGEEPIMVNIKVYGPDKVMRCSFLRASKDGLGTITVGVRDLFEII